MITAEGGGGLIVIYKLGSMTEEKRAGESHWKHCRTDCKSPRTVGSHFFPSRAGIPVKSETCGRVVVGGGGGLVVALLFLPSVAFTFLLWFCFQVACSGCCVAAVVRGGWWGARRKAPRCSALLCMRTKPEIRTSSRPSSPHPAVPRALQRLLFSEWPQVTRPKISPQVFVWLIEEVCVKKSPSAVITSLSNCQFIISHDASICRFAPRPFKLDFIILGLEFPLFFYSNEFDWNTSGLSRSEAAALAVALLPS